MSLQPFTLYSRAYWAWVPWAKLREQAGAEWVWMPEYSEWQSGARPYFMVARASTLTLIARSRKQQQQQQQAGTSWSADAGPSTAAPATAQGPADPQKDADAYWQSQLWELAPVCSGRWLSVEAVMHRRRAQIMRCTRLTPSKRAQLLQVLGEDHAEAEAQAEAEGAGAGTGADDAGAVGSGGTEPGTTFGTGGGPTGYQSAAERQEPQHMWGINGSGSGGGSDSGADDDGGGADDDSSSQLGRVAAGSSGSGDEDGAAVACVGSDDEGGLDGAHGQGSEGTGAGGRGPKHHTAFPIHPEPGGKRRKHQLAVRAAEQWLTHIHPYDNSAAAGAGSNPSR